MNGDLVDASEQVSSTEKALRAIARSLRADHRLPASAQMVEAGADEIERLRAEVATLRRWKAEATSVITAWDDAFDAARIGGVLGSFKWAATFAEIERLRAAVALLWDLMPDDQCFDVSARAPKTYVLAQDLWGQRLGAAAGPHHPAAPTTSEVQP